MKFKRRGTEGDRSFYETSTSSLSDDRHTNNSRPDTGRLTSCHQQNTTNHQIYIQKDVLLIPVFIFIFILIKKSITFKYLEFTVINNKTQNKYN